MAADVEQPAAKFSRYRSVRRANASAVADDAPPVPEETPKAESLGRSMSRYHRRPTVTGAQPTFAPPERANTQEISPPPPPMPVNTPAVVSRARAATLTSNTHQQQRIGGRRGTTSGDRPSPQSPNTRANNIPPVVERTVRETPKDAREEARQMLEAEAERQRKVRRAQVEAEQRRKAEEAARIRKAQEEEELRMKQDSERIQRLRAKQEEEKARRARAMSDENREAARRALEGEPPMKPTQKSPEPAKSSASPQSAIKEKTGFLRKRNYESAPRQHKSEADLDQARRKQKESEASAPPVPTHAFIKIGGGGIVPGTDAPISAVNAGDRRVLVECSKSSIRLPVTPTTTPLDLIRSAETVLSEPIDVKMSVLLESFSKVGVQRPLRKYEHVRDVMNSWDDDKQNSLILVPISHGAEEELEEKTIPKEKPEYSCYIYHSQRPGKWKKEWVTLRSDGQILVAKNEAGKDESSLCHLSDFDIYTPTQRKIKEIKPPKKTCFAIKSQQKSNIFSDTTNFVHFFCTGDRDVSTKFYKTIQSWRSWYLVNVMGEGKQEKDALSATPFKLDLNLGGAAAKGHARDKSVDSHYKLGTFQSVFDTDNMFQDMKFSDPYIPPLHRTGETLERSDPKTMHARKMSVRNKTSPPSSYPAHMTGPDSSAQSGGLSALARNAPVKSDSKVQQSPQMNMDNSAFEPTGLLGRTYSTRQKQQQEREAAAQGRNNGPFTNGPSLINSRSSLDNSSSGLRRNTSVRSSHHRNSSSEMSLRPSQSVRRPPGASAGPPPGMPKPLVDLTPRYEEPVHHRIKGRGYRPDGPQQSLVESATTPETAFTIPPGSDWRARPTGPTVPRGQGAPSGALHTQENPYAAERSEDAFTGQGLLARAGPSQGDERGGRGVMDGSKAKGPMLDLNEGSRFAPGSLLQGVERQQGPRGPVIDRSNRTEGSVPTGEGY